MKSLKLFLLVLLIAVQVKAAENEMDFGKFGTVRLYQNTTTPSRVVIFISGDGGWNSGVVDMARALAKDDALVIGVDIIHYLQVLARESAPCSYPAADFEALSQYTQKKLQLPTYTLPVLIGYSSGATLAYATIVEAPPNTFAGAISMGFCPDLPITKPFCKGDGLEATKTADGKGFNFLPAANLQTPWIAFQGEIDQVCSADSVRNFVSKVKGAQVVMLPKVGHGFSVQHNWLPQLRASFAQLTYNLDSAGTIVTPDVVRDLPLVELPAATSTGDYFALIVSGDGGWAGIDKRLGEYFVSRGIPVVGLNSLKYFWTRRTPDGASTDLMRIISHYMGYWKKEKVLLVGYSRGADVLPFMTNRLPTTILSRVLGLALLGLEPTVDFQFHLSDWLGGSEENALPVKPEIEKLRGMKIVCVYGLDEKHSLCGDLDTNLVIAVPIEGGHHFDGDYETIGRKILEKVSP